MLPLLSTGLLAAVLYLLGTRHVNRIAGVLGTVLALATPLVFVNLTRGYTDLTATMLCGAALLVAVLARDLAARRGPGAWGRAVPGLLVACGVLLGWSVEVRETSVFTWPVILWVLWGVGSWRRSVRWVIPPIAAWLLLDLLLLQLVYGDPLLKAPLAAGRRHRAVRGDLGRGLRRSVALVVHHGPAALRCGRCPAARRWSCACWSASSAAS